MYKKEYRLAEIDRQIQLMIDAKAKIQEEEEEEQIKERRAYSEKIKRERKRKEKEQMEAKSEAKRKEAEEKAKENAKAEKEEWKRALRRPAATPEEKARKEAENEARKEAEEAVRKELEEEARKEAEEKARNEADEKARKDSEEKAKKDEEEKNKSEKQQRNVGKRAEDKGEEKIIARGIKNRRLTEEEKEKKQNMEKMEEAHREIRDIVKQAEEDAKKRGIREKIEKLTAKLSVEENGKRDEKDTVELEREREAFDNPPVPPRDRMPFYSRTVARFECQSDLDSAPKSREDRSDRERMSLGASGKILFKNTLMSAAQTVNEKPATEEAPRGRRPTPVPGQRQLEKSPIRKNNSYLKRALALEKPEETIYKIRKLLLEAADRLSELADLMYPYDGQKTKKEETAEESLGIGCSSSFM